MLQFFEQKDGSLLFRANGELVALSPWGKNGLRCRACFAGELAEGSAALLGSAGTDARIIIEERFASIASGDIKAELRVTSWGDNFNLQISYYNGAGKLLLREISSGGALLRKARHFKPLAGGSYKLTASLSRLPLGAKTP